MLCVSPKKTEWVAMKMKRHVLVVDDEKSTLALVCQLLEKLGHHTTPVHGGEEALKSLANDVDIDFVLTDINMPVMDGWELAGRIKAMHPNLPIIAMTGECPAEVMPRLKNEGISAALFKPFKMNQLKEAVSGGLALA